MKNSTIRRLNSINQQFYQGVATEFDRTRQHPWLGWQRLKSHLPLHPLSVLDVGCGNGRFGVFLQANHSEVKSYVGIDNSQELLDQAQQKLGLINTTSFVKGDIVADGLSLHSKVSFDVVALLAVLHHVPSEERRIQLIKQAIKRLKSKGIFIVSLWRYHQDSRFEQKQVAWSVVKNLDLSQLEPGDVLLTWNNDPRLLRYVHIFSDGEINRLLESLPLPLIDRFQSDGRSNSLNEYLVFRY